MSATIDLKQLTPDQLRELTKQVEAENSNKKKLREQNVFAYKSLIDETVNSLAPELADFATVQNLTVDKTFKAFEQALKFKMEIYEYSDDQSSHTFTARDGMASITIGHNVIIGFDGTEAAGVSKIRQYLASLGQDDETREILLRLLNTFMKPDKKGNLNPARIAELIAQKDMVKSELFSEGVDVIVNAQFKSRSSQYVRGWYKRMGENGKELRLNFSITANT